MMTNPDKSAIFIPRQWKFKKTDLKSYLGSEMNLNTLSLWEFVDEGPGSAR
jgi:hypothetical protein